MPLHIFGISCSDSEMPPGWGTAVCCLGEGSRPTRNAGSSIHPEGSSSLHNRAVQRQTFCPLSLSLSLYRFVICIVRIW
jgi:hypothetical protein